VRKIPKSLAIMGLLTPLVAPVNAGALGIGDIRLRSNLNQPLNAEIPLVTSGSDSLSEIRISLAPPEAFARAGIERQYFLSKLRFHAAQKPDGSTIIQVTSQDPITEPFLNFLLEVNWPQGHLLREFTALIDPPATYEGRAVVPTEAPEIVAAPAIRSSETAKPVVPRKSATAAAGPSAAALPPAGTYGPVKKDETLWGIARLLAPEAGVSADRMMRALFLSNPQAFFRNDINALKAGATLAIPSKESILQGRPVQAVSAAPPEAPLVQKARPKPPAPPPAEAAVVPRGELKLYTPSESKPEAQPAIAAPTTGETAAPAKPAEEAARPDTRISDLQKQLNALQAQLSVKDEQIATLQAQQQIKQAKPEAAVQPPQETPPPPTTQEQPPATVPAPPVTPPAPQPPVTVTKPPEPAPVLPKPAVQPPAPQQPPVEAPKAEQNWFNWLPEAYYLEVAGAGTLLVGALIWVAVRRRAAMLDDFESMFPRDAQESAFSEIYAQKPVDSKMAPPDGTSSFKSSFLVEFSASDFDALDTESDELDPISEADVYLAYGRYKQAEELIRNAIVQYPERDECKLKLLEIHYATENRDAFEAYAKELYGQKKDSDPEFWGKVMEMGRELCPDSALFYSSDASILQLGGNDLFNRATPEVESAEFAPLEPPKPAARDDSDDTLVPTPNKPAEPPPAAFTRSSFDEAASDERDDFSLDFESPAKPEPPSPAATREIAEESKPDSMGLDFDLEFLSTEEEPAAQERTPALDFGDQSFADLTDMNELETKLDLAKAFVDMDDVSSAREILEEIAQAGNDEQKKEARSLLAKIE